MGASIFLIIVVWVVVHFVHKAHEEEKAKRQREAECQREIRAQQEAARLQEEAKAKRPQAYAERKRLDEDLVTAVRRDNAAEVLSLLDKGACANAGDKDINVDAYGNDGVFESVLQIAAQQGNLRVVQALLSNGANVNFIPAYQRPPLYEAIKKGYLEVAQALIENGADPNTKDYFGMTVLMLSTSGGHIDLVQALLHKGANVNARMTGTLAAGKTALNFASNRDVAELLLANKADVNAKDNDGHTPLHDATREGHKDVAELLLANKADVNAKDKYGHTPLHEATGGGRKDVAELLLQHGGHE